MFIANIHLDTVTEAKKFVNLCNAADFEVSLVSDRYVVNAKSIMGIFSLDLSQPVKVQAECGPDDPFVQKLEAFIVPGNG